MMLAALSGMGVNTTSNTSIVMAREFVPAPPTRRVLIPRRRLHLPFCPSCLKPITTQFAMEGENRRQESWRRHLKASVVQAGSGHQGNPDSLAMGEAIGHQPVLQPAAGSQAVELVGETDSNRAPKDAFDEFGTA